MERTAWNGLHESRLHGTDCMYVGPGAQPSAATSIYIIHSMSDNTRVRAVSGSSPKVRISYSI